MYDKDHDPVGEGEGREMHDNGYAEWRLRDIQDAFAYETFGIGDRVRFKCQGREYVSEVSFVMDNGGGPRDWVYYLRKPPGIHIDDDDWHMCKFYGADLSRA